MSFSLCLQVFILSFVILDGVHAFEGEFNVRKNEFSLKNMKKVLPGSSTDEFDCVDIRKQPAFDHPLLINHKIQLEPGFLKDSKKVSSEPGFLQDSKKVSSKRSCPPGKVPIAKATTTSDPENIHELNSDYFGQHFAVVESVPGYKLHGARASIELHNPHPLQNFQFSMATVWVLGGPKSELNSLQAGWGVHPFLYKDNYTHFTIFWTADNFAKTGCYNTQCSGFVQTHHFYYPGQSFILDPVEDKNHDVFDVYIAQDDKTGNWWIILAGTIGIGYWPKEILPHLAEGTSQVRYGGWTGNLPSLLSPPMGNGRFASKNIPRSSHFAKLRVLDSSYTEVIASTLSMTTRIDAPKCYNGFYSVNQGPEYRDLFAYGGPGGSCGV